MFRKTLTFFAFFCFIISNLTAQTVVNVAAGGLSAAVRAAQPNLSLVTGLTVTGTIDARDFRFIRDSLQTTLASLDLSGVSIVAYSGTAGTDHTAPPFFGAGGGADKQADYADNEVPVSAFYKSWTEGGFLGSTTVEVKMTALQTLILPTNITAIANSAFRGSAVTALNLSALTGCLTIGENVFSKMTDLQTITLPPNVGTIGSKPFAMCASLQSLTIPSSVTSLGTSSGFFEGCTSLSSVVFQEPCRITTLPYAMFSPNSDPEFALSSLTTVTLPSSAVTNVESAFENFMGTAIECHPDNPAYYSANGILYKRTGDVLAGFPKGISTFTIPATMTVIPARMFENCVNLTSVTVLSNLTEIGDFAFNRSGITSFTFPSTLEKIGQYAFAETKLQSVSMTNNASLTQWGGFVFNTCTSLKTANLTGISTLADGMFSSCDSLTTITLNPNLTKIPTSAFAGCSELQSISIPNSVTEIGNYAFMSCVKLASVTLPNQLTTLGNNAFTGCMLLTSMNLPATFALFDNAFYGTHIKVTVDAANPNFSAENGMLFNKTKTKLRYVPAYTDVRELVLPATVDTIAAYAFATNNTPHSVKKLTLPFGLKHIGNYGLNEAANVDTLVVKGITPAECANNLYSLNNDWWSADDAANGPLVMIPPKTLDAYKAANGWKNYYRESQWNNYVMVNQFYHTSNSASYATNVSPNGRYVTADGPSGGYLWDFNADGTFTLIPNSVEAADVNDAGMITGKFNDSNYMIGGKPLENGGVYRDGQWYSLGLGRYGTTTNSAEVFSSVNAITADGAVYGMAYAANLGDVLPFIWKYNQQNDNYTTDTMTWAAPFDHSIGDQGARFQDVSSDGTVAAGWISRWNYGGIRQGIIWTSPTDYFIVDEENEGEAAGVSPNGKYIATSKGGKAAVYNTETQQLTVFGPANSSAKGVSNDGFVVGSVNRGAYFEDGKQAFVWSEKLGYMNMLDFITEYCPDIVLPSDPILSFSNTEARFDQPMGISADGLVIAGWSGYGAFAREAWVICLSEPLDLIDRPKNLQASVNITDRNKAALSWTALTPAEYGSHTLDFYYIYRDGVKVGQVEPHEGTAYLDENVPAGKHIYTVSAIYDYTSVGGVRYLESGQSDYAEALIVDNYNLPFYENFEYGYEHNYWDAQISAVCGWNTITGTGFSDRISALLYVSGSSVPYNISLTSKPLDAAGHNKVILSFIYRINAEQGQTFLGIRDTVKIEIGVGDVWQTVENIVVQNVTNAWLPVTLDVSQYAANSLFKVRLRAVSGANRNFAELRFDDLGVSLESNDDAPTGVIAYKMNGGTDEHVLYKDRTGAYSLTHAIGQVMQTIGNEGNPFIAAQKFEPVDLLPLKDKYLTSVSAYVHRDFDGAAPTQLKLAVWVNETRVESGEVTALNGNAWNTFILDAPIHLTGSETIIAGIEVAQHDVLALPLAMDNVDSLNTNPKGNLLSYNDGQTWINPSKEEGYHGMWNITVNVRDEATAQTIDKDEFEVAYQIKRGANTVATLTRGQHYVDANAPANSCYTVRSFSALGGLSPESEQGCEQILTGISKVENAALNVYPNPATDIVHIDGEFGTVNIYDEQGRLVLATNKKDIDVKTWTRGIYLFRTTLVNGKAAMAKVIIK